jgi:hypothetical protein
MNAIKATVMQGRLELEFRESGWIFREQPP